MIEKGHEERNNWVRNDEKEDIEQKSFEVERKDSKGWFILANQVK
jgi:hypothetical protein